MSSGSKITGPLLNKLCDVCSNAAQLDNPRGCTVANPAAAAAMCSCWEKQVPIMNEYYAELDHYNSCKSTSQDDLVCIPGSLTWWNPVTGKNETVQQKCSNPNIPGSINYTGMQLYLQQLQKYAADYCAYGDPKYMVTDKAIKYGAGGTYSHYEADGTPRTTGLVLDSGSYLPMCGPTGADNVNKGMPCSDYCGTLDKCIPGPKATGRFGDGAWCPVTGLGWAGSATRGYGLAWMSDPANAAKIAGDASFMHTSRGSTIGAPQPPGTGRYWRYSTSGKGTSDKGTKEGFEANRAKEEMAAVSVETLVQNSPAGQPQQFHCIMTATQTWIHKNQPPAPLQTDSIYNIQSPDQVCGQPPVVPTTACCINSVNIGSNVNDVNLNVQQSCVFTKTCDPDCKGPDCPPCAVPPKPGDKDYCSKGGANCSGHGACTNNKCICGIDRDGPQCELAASTQKTGGPDLISKFNKLPERRKIGGYILIIVIAMILMAIVALVATR